MKNDFYTCPYCHQEYENPVDLAHCILSCEEKDRIEKAKIEAERKRAEVEAAAKKLAEEKRARDKEIEEAEKRLSELYKQYIKDYGYIKKTHNAKDYDDFFIPFLNKLWL